MQFQFTPQQVFVVGVVATLLSSLLTWIIQSVIPWFIRVVWKKPIQVDIGRFSKTIIVALVALALGWWWFPVSLPALPAFTGSVLDYIGIFLKWLPVLTAAIMPYLGAAVAIYNLLFGYLTDPDRRKQWLNSVLEWLGLKLPPIEEIPAPNEKIG